MIAILALLALLSSAMPTHKHLRFPGKLSLQECQAACKKGKLVHKVCADSTQAGGLEACLNGCGDKLSKNQCDKKYVNGDQAKCCDYGSKLQK